MAASVNIAFLTAITSARRVGELRALMVHPPYMIFYRDKGSLRLHPKFIRMISSDIHLNQMVQLPVFYPKPHNTSEDKKLHSLSIRRALSFNLNRTKLFWHLSEVICLHH